ncbi:hypothetical protein JW916_11810 [Candidatus Sumerlaeota bacterium]|nr:hypothetical protein [Candidatus Sumerlaeota bacterium]
MKPATWIAVAFLALVSVLQSVRFILRIEVIAGGRTVPVWLSAVASAFTGALACALWWESRRK